MKKRDMLTLRDLTRPETEEILDLALSLKQDKKKGVSSPLLAGKKVALVFQKPSLRTRATFEIGMSELGGHSLFLGPDEISLGRRETPADCARVLSPLVDLIVVRTFAQETVEEMARFATVPVINGLTDVYHPCQILADALTLTEHKGRLGGLKIAFVGDGNNIVHSWLLLVEKFPIEFAVACPKGFEPDDGIVRSVIANGARVSVAHDVAGAVANADAIYTDVWASMGQEAESKARNTAFQGYQVNGDVVAMARPDALVMHCLPAHRGEEITHDVLEGKHSVVFEQAENRLHAQKALMIWLLK